MENTTREAYDDDFYSSHIEGMSKSSAIVLGLLYDQYQPQSVIDVGCGRGAWLASAEALGAKKLQGFDGAWVTQESLISKNINFSPLDLDAALPNLTQKYDLCISLEVAEHLSPAKAREFIDFLCAASDVVLFGAAIKYQGGTNHINEQWQSYWIEIFKSNGYECLDLFRPRLWNNDSVEWWYRQNMFLFVRRGNAHLDLNKLRQLQEPIFDIAHPVHYEEKIRSFNHQIENPSFRLCVKCFKGYLRKKLFKIKKKTT